jgi:hypothetical protein
MILKNTLHLELSEEKTTRTSESHEMALELISEAENRCKSSWARPGPSPRLPATKFGRKTVQHLRIPVRFPLPPSVGLPLAGAVNGAPFAGHVGLLTVLFAWTGDAHQRAIERVDTVLAILPYTCIRFGGIHGPKPYKFIRFGALDATKPYKCLGFGDLRGPQTL